MTILHRTVETVFPRPAERCAARVGTVCLILAFCVAVLFPVSAHAGTEVPVARWTTTGALVVAWALLRWSQGRLGWIVAGEAALVVGAFAAPAPWLLWLAALGALYVATAFVPRPAYVPHAEDEDPPLEAAQEILESIGVALVLALVVREFGFEAFKIPTGSMEPTILGDSGARKGKGDRLLAFKVVEYRRYDIVVFRFPIFRRTNYIKRLIGLPGEHVEIRDGDIYANGVIASKPDDVQEVLWHEADAPPAEDDWRDVFERETAGAWTTGVGSVEVDVTGGDPAGAVAWTQLRGSTANDQRVSFDVEMRKPGGEIFIALEGGQRRCELRLGQDGAEVTVPGSPSTWTPRMPGLRKLGPKFRLGFSVADRIARVYVDGRQVDSFRHEDVPNGGLDGGRVRIGARGLSAVVRRLVVEDDLQYDGTHAWDVPADGYVMLGDNTTRSQDSRFWKAYVVRTKAGREYTAPEDARLSEDGPSQRTWFERADGSLDFIDSYGVRRHVEKDDLAEPPRRNVLQPFARKDDLVGRAFLVFWPIPPWDAFRPRLLR